MRVLFICSLVVMVVSASGCSFLFEETVPDHYETMPYFDCTSTMGLPVADGVIGASSAVQAVSALTESKAKFKSQNGGGSRDLVAGIGIGTAALLVASAVFGIVHGEQCSAAKATLKARLLPPPTPERSQRLIGQPEASPTLPMPQALAPLPAPVDSSTPMPIPAAPSDATIAVPAPPPSPPPPAAPPSAAPVAP